MEYDERIQYPYYETSYLDDNNTKHIAYIKSKEDLNFYQERFTILNSEYKEY